MTDSLSSLLMQFRKAPTGVAFTCPVLMWEAPAAQAGEHWEQTRGHHISAPLDGDPRILRVEKGAKANNAFSFGVTVGRVDTNDIVLEDNSISRFHAFLRLDEKAKTWFLTDAESKNGTWIDEKQLKPNQAVALQDKAKLKFGDAAMTFLLPETFKKLLLDKK